MDEFIPRTVPKQSQENHTTCSTPSSSKFSSHRKRKGAFISSTPPSSLFEYDPYSIRPPPRNQPTPSSTLSSTHRYLHGEEERREEFKEGRLTPPTLPSLREGTPFSSTSVFDNSYYFEDGEDDERYPSLPYPTPSYANSSIQSTPLAPLSRICTLDTEDSRAPYLLCKYSSPFTSFFEISGESCHPQPKDSVRTLAKRVTSAYPQQKGVHAPSNSRAIPNKGYHVHEKPSDTSQTLPN